MAQANVEVCIDVKVRSWSAERPKETADTPKSAPPPVESSKPVETSKPLDPSKPVDAAATPPNEPPADFNPVRDFYGESSKAAAVTPEASVAPKVETGSDPHALDPARYLRRLLEYEVTHAEGFVATDAGCAERIEVELYSLSRGYTVFARSSKSGREEKVDRVELDEFEPLAERIADALLHDKPIGETLSRENVLRADNERAVRTVRGRSHAAFALGTSVRVGELPTAVSEGGPVEQRVRVLTPFDVQLGYRRKIHSWGLDVFTRLNFGTENTALRSNDRGGHVDYSGSGALGLHFLRYLNGAGVNSFYVGAGATVELSLFDVIKPTERRNGSDRSWLLGGGLNVDAFIGYEILRASAVHFFTQLELTVPTYALETENTSGSLDTYFPGGLVQVGVVL